MTIVFVLMFSLRAYCGKGGNSRAYIIHSKEATVDFKSFYDEKFILRTHSVHGPLFAVVQKNSTTRPFLCTHCEYGLSDEICDELMDVCWTTKGCYRHVFIKFDVVFVNKGCWHANISREYGSCNFCSVPDTPYNPKCFCETCRKAMCNVGDHTKGRANESNVVSRPSPNFLLPFLLFIFTIIVQNELD